MSASSRLVQIACVLGFAACGILLLAPGATSQQPRTRVPPRPVRTLPPRPPLVPNFPQNNFNGTNFGTAPRGFVVASQTNSVRQLVFPVGTGLGGGFGVTGFPGAFGVFPTGGGVGMPGFPTAVGVGGFPAGLYGGFGVGIAGYPAAGFNNFGPKGFGFNGGSGL